MNYKILKNIAENIPVSLNVFDAKGKRIWVNPYYYHLGGKKDEFEFKDYFTIDGVRRNDLLNSKVKDAIRKKKKFEVKNFYYHSRSTKTKRYLDIYIIPIVANMHVIGAFSMAYDTTSRNIARKKLMKLNRTLEEKISDRTAKLARANQKLEKMMREKNVFVSDVAHEIKTILAVIRGNMDMLNFERNSKDPLDIECDFEIKKAIDKLSGIISDLVFITKSEHYANTFRFEKLDLAKLIQSVINDKLVIKNKKKISIIFKKGKAAQNIINADRTKLTLLISNIFENAIKYGKENGKLEIKLNGEKNKIFLTFKDDGIGIKKDDLPSIFEPFFQVKKTQEKKLGERGFGMGLSICKKIVEAHKGKILAESGGLGKGSIFTIIFPRVQPD